MGEGAKQGGVLRIAATGRMLTGVALLQQGRTEQALEWLKESQANCADALGPEHATTQLYALNVAVALAELQRVPEAITAVRHAEPVLREALGADAPIYQDVLALLRRLENRSAVAAPTDTISTTPQRSTNTPPAPGFFS